MRCNRICSKNNLHVSRTVTAVDTGGFIQNRPDVMAVGDYGAGNDPCINGQFHGKGEYCDIPNHIEMIRKGAACVVGDDPLYLIPQTHDFPHYTDLYLLTITAVSYTHLTLPTNREV